MDSILKNTVGYRPKVYTTTDLDCPVIANVDVVVVGGSQSGVAAAISCARAAKQLGKDAPKILLVEQNTYLGGQSVTNMVTQWEIPAFRQNVGKWQIRGIGLEMVGRIVSFGGSDKLWEDLVSLNGQDGVEWPFLGNDRFLCGEESLNVEAIKIALQEMCLDEGIELLLDTRAVAAIETKTPPEALSNEGLGALPGSKPATKVLKQAAGTIVEYNTGRGAIIASQVIDATANGTFCWWLGGEAGCTVNPAKNRGLTQSYIWIGGVNMDEFIDWVLSLPDSVFETYPDNKEQIQKHVETGRLVWFKSRGIGKPEEVFNEADEVEDLDILFKANFVVGGFYMKWVGNYPGHGVFALDGPYYREDSLDGKIWTSEHIRNLYGSWGMFRIFRHIPGCKHAYIARTCERMGLRTTRVPKGIYTITGKDLADHAEKVDAIGVGDWHDRSHLGEEGVWGYHVPLRALIPNVIDGLTFCARAVSFDPAAMNAHRGIGTTIVCGQGAGVASAVAFANGIQPRQVNPMTVQKLLRMQDVVLEIPRT
ncbi:MAG: FAD-dependent oxidoreductase [Promethearchaeota archaeon]